MNFDVKYIFHLVDRFSDRARKMAASARTATGDISKMGAAFLSAEKGVNRLARGMRSLRTIGKNIAFGGMMSGLGGTFVLHDIIRTNYQFSDVMNEVVANMQASDKAFRPAIEKLVLKTAENTKFTADQVGQMTLELARMGNSAQQIMTKLPVSAEFATAAGTNPQDAIDRLTNMAQAFGYKDTELRQVADLFTQAFTNSPQTFYQMGEALKFAAPIASSVGVSLREVSAALMTLAPEQQKGSLAGTGIARSLEAFFKSSGPADKAMKSIGLTKDKFIDANGQLKYSFIEMLEVFNRAGDKYGGKALSQAIQRVFGARGARAMRKLIPNVDKLKEAFAKLGEAEGVTAQKSQERMAGLAGALNKLNAAWTALKIQIGKAQMNEDIIAIADAVRKFIKRFKELDPLSKTVIARLVLGLGALAALAIPLGILAFTVGALITPVGLIVVGLFLLAAAIAAVLVYREDIIGFFEGLWDQLKADWAATLEQYQGYWDDFVAFLESIPDRLLGLGQRIANAMRNLVPSSTGWSWLDRQMGLADTASRAAREVEAGTGRSETAAASTRVTEGKVDITSRVETNVTAPPEIPLTIDGIVAGKLPLKAQTAPKGQNMPKTPGGPPMADSVTAQ